MVVGPAIETSYKLGVIGDLVLFVLDRRGDTDNVSEVIVNVT